MSRSAENQYTNKGMSRDGSKSRYSPNSTGSYSERNIFVIGLLDDPTITLARVRGVGSKLSYLELGTVLAL